MNTFESRCDSRDLFPLSWLPSCQMRFSQVYFIKTFRECRFTVKASAEIPEKYQSRYALQTAATPPALMAIIPRLGLSRTDRGRYAQIRGSRLNDIRRAPNVPPSARHIRSSRRPPPTVRGTSSRHLQRVPNRRRSSVPSSPAQQQPPVKFIQSRPSSNARPNPSKHPFASRRRASNKTVRYAARSARP